MGWVPEELGEAIAVLDGAVAQLQHADLDAVDTEALLQAVRDVEVLRRRLDHATDRLAGQVDRTGAFRVDGHRSAKAAVKHLGRLPGAEAHARVRTARLLRRLPAVAAAYEAGTVPTPSLRAIVRVAANPRVEPFLSIADPIFAELAASEPYDDFVRWLQQWESLADADGAEQDAERTHRNRNARLVQDPSDLSWQLRAELGSLQGAAMAEILAAFEAAELEADRLAALDAHGPDATLEQYPRTPGQRRADAVFAVFRAAVTPVDGPAPVPLVNVITDQETLESEIERATDAPEPDEREPGSSRPDERICRTTSGHPVHPSDVLAAALIGHIRRVLVDSASTVIDVGRRRRCFTGSSREAAQLQGALRNRGGPRCVWSACDGAAHWLQVDHHQPWRARGPTDVANSDLVCGFHNRLKESGFRPVRAPDGTWTLVRPDGTPITPAA